MKDDARRYAQSRAAIKALDDVVRQKILLLLLVKRRDGLTHKQVLAEFLTVNQPAIGKHLTLLKDAGLIQHHVPTDPGEEKRYFLTDAGAEWLGRVKLAENPEHLLAVIEREIREGRT